MSILPLLYKYHEFYNIFYYISSFANPVLTYRCYANGLNIEPSNTNKYITGTLNKGQREEMGKGGRGKGRGEEGEREGGRGKGGERAKGKKMGRTGRRAKGKNRRKGQRKENGKNRGRTKGKKMGKAKGKGQGWEKKGNVKAEKQRKCFTDNCSKFSYSHI